MEKVVSLLFFLMSFLPQSTYTEGLVGQPRHINPLKIGTNSVDKDLARLIFRGLMKYDQNGDLVTDLAERYEISPDQIEYTITLRKGVYWHDGLEFTADDVLYTISIHPQLKMIRADRLDRYKIRFVLREPFSPFLDLLTLGISPFRKTSSPDDLTPIGTGDYRLVRFKKSDKIDEAILLRVGKTKGGSDRNFSRLVFKFYDKPSDLLMAAKLGEIDGFVSEEPVPRMENFNRLQTPLGSRYYAVFFNLEGNDNLKNKDFRRDIARSIPKEKIIEDILRGSAVSAESPNEYTFAAGSSFKHYGYESLPLKYDVSLSLVVPKKQTHLQTAEIIRNSLEKIGIHLNMEPVEIDKITNEIIGGKKFDLLLLGQEVGRDPDVYSLWHSTQKNLPGLNFTGFESVLADKALEEGRRNRDTEERLKHYQNFQKVFSDEVPAVFLYRPLLTYSLKTEITGVSLEGLFKSEDRFFSVQEWHR